MIRAIHTKWQSWSTRAEIIKNPLKRTGQSACCSPCLSYTPQAIFALLQQYFFKKDNAFWGLLLKMQQQPAFEILRFNNHWLLFEVRTRFVFTTERGQDIIQV